jgi:hypothetical protein
MLRKKFIFENEEQELSDFEKITRAAKGNINLNDLDFVDSEGNDYSDYIDITYDGLVFTFDGLADYLRFFFKDEYEEGSESYHDADNYGYMYTGNYDWRDEFYNKSTDEWREGYILDRLTPEHFDLIKTLVGYLSPELYGKLQSLTIVDLTRNDKLKKELSNFLETIDLSDDIIEEWEYASVEGATNKLSDGIKDTYCDVLSEIGIERYSQKYCFWKYEMDWGSCMILYARFGTDEDNFLDLLFQSIKKLRIKHLPVWYEMEYEFWDNDAFNEYWVPKITKILEEKIEEIEDEPDYFDEIYKETLSKVLKLGGIDKWLTTKDDKYQIRINSIDPQTSLISYSITPKGGWRAKSGKTDIEGLITMFYNEKLFDLTESKKRFSILRKKSIL